MIRACLGKSIKRLAHKLCVPSSSTVPVTLGELQTGTFEGEATNPTSASFHQPTLQLSSLTFWLLSNPGYFGLLPQEVFSITSPSSLFHLRQFHSASPNSSPGAWRSRHTPLSAHSVEGMCSSHPRGRGFHQWDNPWEGQEGKEPSGSPGPISHSLSNGFNNFHNIQRNRERILKIIAI